MGITKGTKNTSHETNPYTLFSVKNNVPPRSFMLVAKVLTKLANETPFMQQDADYQFLNEFLEKNTARLHQFYDDIIVRFINYQNRTNLSL